MPVSIEQTMRNTPRLTLTPAGTVAPAPEHADQHRHKEEFMSVEIRVPQLPESVADATLVAWRKQPGQAVSRDENLADLETDKVVLEVPAPTSGVLREIKVQTGTSVKSGELLAVIDEGAAAAQARQHRRATPRAAAVAGAA